MNILKYQGASDTSGVPFFMCETGDYRTPLDALNVSTEITILLSKGLGTFASLSSPTITNMGYGWYKWAPTNADLSHYGTMLVHFSGVGAVPFDAAYTVSDIEAHNMLDNITGTPPTGEIAEAVWAFDERAVTSGENLYLNTGTQNQIDNIDVYVQNNNALILDIPTDVWATAIIESTAPSALLYYANQDIQNLNDISTTDIWQTSVDGVHASALLDAAATAGGGATTGDIAQGVWAFETRGLTEDVTVGTNNDKTDYSLTAALNTQINSIDDISGTIAALNDISAADVWAVGTRGLTEDVTVGTNNDKTGYSIAGTKNTLDDLNDITVANIWQNSIDGVHASALLDVAASPGGGSLTAEQVWAYAIDGDTASGLLDAAAEGSSLTVDQIWSVSIEGDTGSGLLNTAASAAGATPAQIWAYSGRSLDTAVAVSGSYDKTGYTITNTIPGSADNAQATWEYSTRALTDKSNFTLTSATETQIDDIETAVNAISVPTTGDISTAVWANESRELTNDSYYANILYQKDESNSQDEYTAMFYKNAAPIMDAGTSPQIQVLNRLGNPYISWQTMPHQGSGIYKYDSTGTLLTNGESYIVEVKATIDTGVRLWRRIVGRDSTSG